MAKPKIGSESQEIGKANHATTAQVDAGGNPSPGTPKDKRLKENKTVVSK